MITDFSIIYNPGAYYIIDLFVFYNKTCRYAYTNMFWSDWCDRRKTSLISMFIIGIMAFVWTLEVLNLSSLSIDSKVFTHHILCILGAHIDLFLFVLISCIRKHVFLLFHATRKKYHVNRRLSIVWTSF